MTFRFLPHAVLAATVLAGGGAFAQEAAPHAGHGATAAAEWPAACSAAVPEGGKAEAPMAEGSAMPGATGPVQAGNMAAMAEMHGPMMRAALIEDADLAFNCGMIAHHLGAIAMSKVELEHGKDAESRALAEAIIAAQKQEIAEMTAWVDARGK